MLLMRTWTITLTSRRWRAAFLHVVEVQWLRSTNVSLRTDDLTVVCVVYMTGKRFIVCHTWLDADVVHHLLLTQSVAGPDNVQDI